MDMQRTWGLSHVGFLILAAIYLLNSLLIGSRLLHISYKLSLLCLLTGYGIAVKRHVGHFSPDLSTLERAFSYDGTPYFCLALMWWMMASPVAITLAPLCIYSLYHAVAWAKDDAEVKRTSEWRQWGESLCRRLTAQQSTMLFLAAHLEIASLPYMALTWPFQAWPGHRPAPLLCPISTLAHAVSPKIRAALRQWDAGWEAVVQHPSCPRNVRGADRRASGGNWQCSVLLPIQLLRLPDLHGSRSGGNASRSGGAGGGLGAKKFN